MPDRQIAYDLKWVRAVFRWATLAGDQAGGALLERDPTAGFPLPSEASPSRPRMSEERYQAMLAVAAKVHPDFYLALVLATKLGTDCQAFGSCGGQKFAGTRPWFGGAARRTRKERHIKHRSHQLQWTHSGQRGSAVPQSGDVWIFAESHSGASPRSRSTFAKWWREAEDLAGLEREPRLAWHSLRRQFATELKDTPLADLAALGGWKSTATILTCYQQPDVDTMRRALETRRTVRRANGEHEWRAGGRSTNKKGPARGRVTRCRT